MTYWTNAWPTGPGWYWFLGQTSKGMWDREPEYVPVRVHHDGTGEPVYVGRGGFLWQAEGARGLWTRMLMPDPPTDYQIEESLSGN